MRKANLVRPLVIVGLVGLWLVGCSTLPQKPPTDASYTSPRSSEGALAEVTAQLDQTLMPDDSAFLLIPSNDEAMNWRLALIDNAHSSIDAQYFIWKDDEASSLLLEHVFAAADRGGRVRLLVDDMFLSTGGVFTSSDEPIAAIDFHPNIELRLFNPGQYRDGMMGLAGNFSSNLKEYNRRMHNKLMIVDGHFAIVGGRNIGNEYFGLYQPYNFLDLDVLFAGAVVAQASAAFDEYWNADMAYPGGALAEIDDIKYKEIRQLNRDYVSENAEILSTYVPGPPDWSDRLEALPRQMQKGVAVFLQDEPVRRGEDEYRLYDVLDRFVGPGHTEIIVITPYLIPVGNFLEVLESDRAAGTQVSLLTSSLGSNDQTAAHSHYKKYRKRILATGAHLYESRREPAVEIRRYADVAPQRGTFVSLHIKAGVFDRERCFIGSLNVDPRAVLINTENGIYIESPELCGELSGFLSQLLTPDNAWQVSQDDNGRLQWTSSEGTLTSQPARGFGQRVSDFFFSILPIESQL